jgi:IS605 OrfB family transposase
VSERRSNLNDALAWAAARWAAARWAVDQAVAAHATVIYLEDLRSMEAGGMGRTHNTRMSQTVRGRIADRMRHLAAEAGIAVVTVPPRNTSRHCPRCLTLLRHPRPPTAPPHRAGNGPSAPTGPDAAGRATATTAPGSASPHAASRIRTRPSPTGPPGRW